MARRRDKAPTFMDREYEMADPLEWRRLMGIVVKDCTVGGLVLVTPRHAGSGNPIISVTINATVMDLQRFIRNWAATFGDSYYVEVTRPEWPRKYLVYYGGDEFQKVSDFVDAMPDDLTSRDKGSLH